MISLYQAQSLVSMWHTPAYHLITFAHIKTFVYINLFIDSFIHAFIYLECVLGCVCV